MAKRRLMGGSWRWCWKRLGCDFPSGILPRLRSFVFVFFGELWCHFLHDAFFFVFFNDLSIIHLHTPRTFFISRIHACIQSFIKDFCFFSLSLSLFCLLSSSKSVSCNTFLFSHVVFLCPSH